MLGTNYVTVYDPISGKDEELQGTVYNLEPSQGWASDYGVAVPLPKPVLEYYKAPVQLYAHTIIEGSVEWGAEAEGTGKADYHDYFTISVSPLLPLIRSRLVFEGTSGATTTSSPTRPRARARARRPRRRSS